VPTNHLYLGDIGLYPAERAFYPDLTVEEGIRIFLTGGMSLPAELHRRRDTDDRRLPKEER
jgi:ABC-type multidrug transport system ATPase subunit